MIELYFVAALLALVVDASKGFAKPALKRTSESLLIVGLGNPGAEFDSTRHNVGFEVVDYLQTVWKGDDFKTYPQFKAEYVDDLIGD